MTRIVSRITDFFSHRSSDASPKEEPSEIALKGRPPPAVAVDNLSALLARPRLAPDWRPLAVSVHDRRYREMRRAHHYFGEVVAEVTGAPPVRMLCHDDDIVAYVYFFFGQDSYEPLSLRLFAGFAEDGGAVLDIGAYTGLFGLVAAATNPAATVTGFEPFSHVAARARLNIALNGLSNLKLEGKAISDRSGSAALTLYGGSSATTGASLAKKARSDIGVLEVEVTQVDDVASDLPAPVRLMKIDTEGDEPAAMKGAAETLASAGPVVLSEVLSDDAVRAQCAQMFAHGYRAWFISERARRLIPVDENFSLDGRGYGNLIFLRGAEDAARAEALTAEFRELDFVAPAAGR
ncbi:FkbM family methyltransferase [Pikeienuella piscinae]|uniref:FkbM family methyltransferase n=1 Tax=Pikeienuella piscinae TaxID=2748098 RepID=A0A7L5BTW6_9RHOB|nr:FkbM family methyltransferase [Pikeienuella piscinae]QIE54028.1 FkbM family methyltransferase [Pikeienuella piscinae]